MKMTDKVSVGNRLGCAAGKQTPRTAGLYFLELSRPKRDMAGLQRQHSIASIIRPAICGRQQELQVQNTLPRDLSLDQLREEAMAGEQLDEGDVSDSEQSGCRHWTLHRCARRCRCRCWLPPAGRLRKPPPLRAARCRCLTSPPLCLPVAAAAGGDGADFEEALSQPDAPGKVVQITVSPGRGCRGLQAAVAAVGRIVACAPAAAGAAQGRASIQQSC